MDLENTSAYSVYIYTEHVTPTFQSISEVIPYMLYTVHAVCCIGN